MTGRRVRRAAVGGLLVAWLSACGGGSPPTAAPAAPAAPSAPPPSPAAPTPGPRQLVYAAVGASDAFGIGASSREAAWPYVFAREVLPPDARILDLGVPAITTAAAERTEVPAALAAGPDVVTVWLAVNDVLQGVRPADYEAALGRLVHRLRRDGQTTVLLGTTPPLEGLPAYRACRPDPPAGGPRCLYFRRDQTPTQLREVTDAYTAAARRVAAREGARVVDLGAVLRSSAAAADAAGVDDLVAGDGFHPNDAGHTALARAFAAAYRNG